MKNLIMLVTLALCVSSCSLFEKAKPTIIEKVVVVVKKQAIKQLKCSTGEAVASDVEGKLKELLKVKSRENMASASSEKSIGSSICESSMKVVLPYLVDLGDKQLPIAWVEDGCSLDGIGEDLGELSKKLCSKL